MSFADPRLPRPSGVPAESAPASGGRPGADVRRRRHPDPADEARAIDRPRGSPYRRSVDWEHVGLLSAGVLVGVLVGAGAALLFAPQTGRDTRVAIRRQATFARHRASDAWSELADELAAAARRGRRRARRVLRRARWRASDAIA